MSSKAACVCGEIEDSARGDSSGNDNVRTDFILQNTFAHLLKGRYRFEAIDAINKTERDVLEGIKETTDAFLEHYAGFVKSLCSEMKELTEDSAESAFLGVSNELFSKGITWSRIVTFFVFAGEWTLCCLSRNLPNSIVDVMYECFSRLVKEKLEKWIEDHDGWAMGSLDSLKILTGKSCGKCICRHSSF